MALLQKTLYAGTNTGHVIDLGALYSSVKITSTQNCCVKVSSSVLTAPQATQVPSNSGDTTDYFRLAANGTATFSIEFPKGGNDQFGDSVRYVAIWMEGTAGLVVINAH